MGTSTKISHKTYADYQKLKEGEPYQLIDGMFVMSPSPTVFHQRVSKRIEQKLLLLEGKGFGEFLHAPMDVYFSDTEVYQPDIMFISMERSSIVGEKMIQGAPDLIVEVLSPDTGYYDLRCKMNTYETAGVREYWIADPLKKTIEVYENGNGGFSLLTRTSESGTVRSKLFPDFALDVAEVFA